MLKSHKKYWDDFGDSSVTHFIFTPCRMEIIIMLYSLIKPCSYTCTSFKTKLNLKTKPIHHQNHWKCPSQLTALPRRCGRRDARCNSGTYPHSEDRADNVFTEKQAMAETFGPFYCIPMIYQCSAWTMNIEIPKLSITPQCKSIPKW